jgi:hypothetical protein
VADTIDHQPAKIIFTNKHRPAGLEFPACSPCNQQTSLDETILAFVSRMSGSRREYAVLDRYLRLAASGIEQAFPGLLRQMYNGQVLHQRRGILVPHGVLNPNQPEIRDALCRVAAKLALAEYYQRNRSVAPIGTVIGTLGMHSAGTGGQAFEIGATILKVFPHARSLTLGRWSADRDFFMRVRDIDGHQFIAAFFS